MHKNYRIIGLYAAFIAAALLLAGCASSRKDAGKPDASAKSGQAAGETAPDSAFFDPTKLGDDGVFPSETPAPVEAEGALQETQTDTAGTKVVPVEAAEPAPMTKPPETTVEEKQPIPEKFQKDIKRWEEKESPGWRVQILASTVDHQARKAQREAEAKFKEGVYLIYDPPMYKVRVGNCETRKIAQELRQFAVALGYRDAWIVRDKIVTKVPIR